MHERQGIAPDDVVVELLRVDGKGGQRRLADHGDALGIGDRIAVRLSNRTGAKRYGHVFNIGLRKRIAMLSDPGGILLDPGKTAYCGLGAGNALVGFPLRWPVGLPLDQPRTDTLMVIVTDRPHDLGALESREHLVQARGLSPLASLFEQIATGRSRGADAAVSPFAIHWRDFELDPHRITC
jgi:hypothetical protein